MKEIEEEYKKNGELERCEIIVVAGRCGMRMKIIFENIPSTVPSNVQIVFNEGINAPIFYRRRGMSQTCRWSFVSPTDRTTTPK